jgi:hypothetical protein
LHAPVPFPAQAGAGPNIRDAPNYMRSFLAGLLRRAGAIKETPALIIEVTQPVSLQPVSQDPKQQMTG